MSWQCPYCETVNQDAVPVCTVCDRIAPVIESFLSLEQIENIGLYNDKLDEIHQHESKGEYEQMLASALEAIKLYKENDLAVSKMQVAVKRIVESKLGSELIKYIERNLDSQDFSSASNVLAIWETMLPEDERVKSYKTKIAEVEEEERKMKAEAEKAETEEAKKTKSVNSGRHRKFPRLPRTTTSIEESGEVQTDENPQSTPNKTKRKFPKVKRNT